VIVYVIYGENDTATFASLATQLGAVTVAHCHTNTSMLHHESYTTSSPSHFTKPTPSNFGTLGSLAGAEDVQGTAEQGMGCKYK